MKLDYDINFLTFFLVLRLSMQTMHYVLKKSTHLHKHAGQKSEHWIKPGSSFSVSCFGNIHLNSMRISFY